ncbi:hypothetical protein [Bradyrhizobium canariense]|uniref:hypothetical protein n=1 Tax=Bradyrhizobium canariense TaxID=255045 RepID=UPI001B8A313D|nr:hypothetical protein [Bradyrhizobium canariense]MBR0949344.1 hypothetical protein [Bradyrhizobium canariense]
MSVVLTTGKISALTAITKIVPGHAEALRKTLQGLTGANGGKISSLGTIHIVRWVIFDDDTRLFFATNFDGSVEDYMRDFAERAPDGIDAIWGHCEGYPGARDYPKLRDYILGSAIETDGYYCAYPNSTVTDINKALDWKGKFDTFLDQIG